jgi:hypothetical protein
MARKKKLTQAGILASMKGKNRGKFSKEQIKAAAQSLGRKGGIIGGYARAEAIGHLRTRSIAIHAACARWGVTCTCDDCK